MFSPADGSSYFTPTLQRTEVITVQRLAKEAVHRAQLARGDTPLSCMLNRFSAFPLRRCGLAQLFNWSIVIAI